MIAEVEVFVHPYATEKDNYLLKILIEELSSDKWTNFKAAIAFISQTGNFIELLDAMTSFLKKNGMIEMTFGADIFSGTVRGSDYEALKAILDSLENYQNLKLYLYHEKNRTFHPKLYLFSDENKKRALLIVGSSNWGQGGFYHNIEANVLIKLDLKDKDHEKCFSEINEYFKTYWQESE